METDGDIYPFLALGAELRRRGYDVTLATNEDFADRTAKADLEFCLFLSNTEFQEVLSKPDFWHPIRGPVVMARWGKRFLRRQYEVLSALAAAKPTILIASPGLLAARLIQEKAGIPLVTVVLQPWLIPSVFAPTVMMGGLKLPRWAARIPGHIRLRLLDAGGVLLFGRELNHLRVSVGLKRIRRIVQWMFSPELVIGMFPEWFGEPQPDWPRQVRLAGFPSTDGPADDGLSGDTIEFCRAGSPPIAFTFGSGMMHATGRFHDAIEACRILGTRGILLTKFPSQLTKALPTFMHHCAYAPFQKLFPLCAAVVHHGGIGTTAKALAAGVPQLIVPFAYDQKDNAIRVKRLGAGNWVHPRKRSAEAIAGALQRCIQAEATAHAQTIAARFRDRTGTGSAADLVDEFVGRKRSRI